MLRRENKLRIFTHYQIVEKYEIRTKNKDILLLCFILLNIYAVKINTEKK